MKKRLLALFLAAALVITGCGGRTAAPAVPGDGERSITDGVGRQVAVPDRVESVVPAAPLAQIILLAIAPDLMVGLASQLPEAIISL